MLLNEDQNLSDGRNVKTETDLKSDAVDVPSPTQFGVDAVLGEEVERTPLNVDAEVVVIPSEIVEEALVETAPPRHVLHHVPVLHPLLLVQLHREQILALPICQENRESVHDREPNARAEGKTEHHRPR